jgi:hypothetical protein
VATVRFAPVRREKPVPRARVLDHPETVLDRRVAKPAIVRSGRGRKETIAQADRVPKEVDRVPKEVDRVLREVEPVLKAVARFEAVTATLRGAAARSVRAAAHRAVEPRDRVGPAPARSPRSRAVRVVAPRAVRRDRRAVGGREQRAWTSPAAIRGI